MANELCAVCGKPGLRNVKGTYETQFNDRNGNVQKLSVPDAAWEECDNCGEVFLDDAAMQLIETARSHALNLLAPVEIRDLRMRLGKTQKEMSRLLAIGEKTYCRWESGSYLQSTASDRYLRLLMEVPENIYVLERLETGELTTAHHDIEARDIFSYLSDVGQLQQQATVFTNLLEMGQLYTAQA